MRLVFLSLSVLVVGCLQVQNSFENDDNLYVERPPLDLEDPAQLRLQRVRDVFENNNCVSCHASNSSRFQGFVTFSDVQWLSQNCGGGGGACVVAGDVAGSSLYQYLDTPTCARNASRCNMPLNGEMSQEDVDVIVEWIEEL